MSAKRLPTQGSQLYSPGTTMNLSTIKARVDELLVMTSQRPSTGLESALHHGTLGVMQALCGQNSSQEQELRAYTKGLRADAQLHRHTLVPSIEVIKGTLESINAELDAGFVGSLRATLTGEVLSDLIKLAWRTLDEPGDDPKNVASVLTAAAFEDVMRKLSDLKGLPEHERLQDVLIALKDTDVLQRTEVTTAQSYLSFRNNALHAKWSEVDRPVVQSALGFTEQIILKHLT
jgi:hypothetical protein